MARRGFVHWTAIMLALVACIPDGPRGDGQAIPDSKVALPPAPTNLPVSNRCERPYADSSIWNTPIDWSVARIHPDSDKMMKAFWKGSSWIGSDPYQYAPNIYYVDNATPPVPVQLRKNRFRDALDDQVVRYGEPGAAVWMPLPAHAQPAPGTDGQLVAINTETGEEWGIFRGSIDLFGRWAADGVYRYHIRNSGIPPQGFAHRGAGIGSLAGIVRPCEVERGYIDHAVTLAYDYPCKPEVCEANDWPAVIPPFTRTDGLGRSKYDIPEGARLVIRPEIPMGAILQACSGMKGCVVWALAMQKYGGFIVDDSGHPKTYPEGDATAHWDPAIWSKDMLRNIPPEWYDVLDWNVPFTFTQSYPFAMREMP